MYNELPFRPHVSTKSAVMRLIAPNHCWHFDAWLYSAGARALALHTETRQGGRDLLTSHVYLWDGTRLTYLASGIDPGAEPVTLQDKALWPRYAELNRLHWDHILPMAARVPAGFRTRSVALHYIRAPSLDPFSDDAINMHQYGSDMSVPELSTTVPLDRNVQ